MANMGHEAVLPYLKALPKLDVATLFGLKQKQKRNKTQNTHSFQ